MLDLAKVIEDLQKRKEIIERTILQLEELWDRGQTDQIKRRRGRKSMDSTERLEVSTRMKAYWEKRRQRQSGD